jgi:hypothetical protein
MWLYHGATSTFAAERNNRAQLIIVFLTRGGFMKRVITVFALTLLTASTVFAEGIALGWEDGVSVKIPAEPITLQGVLNFSNISAQKNSGIAEGSSVSIAGYGAYPLLTIDKSKLNFFGGLGFIHNPDQDASIGFRFGLEPTVMVSNHVGVGGKLGIQFISIGGADNVDDSGGSTFGLWGIVGVHWFF